jgi:hypothetical protein
MVSLFRNYPHKRIWSTMSIIQNKHYSLSVQYVKPLQNLLNRLAVVQNLHRAAGFVEVTRVIHAEQAYIVAMMS